jgi:hypothetical protein
MNFITALLLLFMEEEETFWMLMTIIDDILPSEFYTSSMLAIMVYTRVFLQIFETRLPRLAQHCDNLGINILPILHHWFLSLFVTVLPLEVHTSF